MKILNKTFYLFEIFFSQIALKRKQNYHNCWEPTLIRLRGFFLESTIPDLGNASGGIVFKSFPFLV